jgi:excinuclease ABC subunit C
VPVALDDLHFPSSPGVYLFKNQNDRVLYIGKATRLNERIRSYFALNPDRAMIPELVERSTQIDFIVTSTAQDALILERDLIRQHKPRYNSMLKDDKSFPFLALTKEEYPRLMYTRHPPKDAERWGPFPNAGAAKQVMQLLRRQFGIRDCKELLPQGCLAMHIGLCLGPCVQETTYLENVKTVRKILNGDATEFLEELITEMEHASERQAFELAASIRDKIRSIRTITNQQYIASTLYNQCDAIGFHHEGDLASIVVLHADDGIVKGKDVWPMVYRGDIGECVSLFVSEYYAHHRPPSLLLTPTPLGEPTTMWLQDRRENSVEIRIPQRGDLKTLLQLAHQNAEMSLQRMKAKSNGSIEQRAADEGARLLEIEQLDYIVCFDMAQFLGEQRVGASVVFRNGRPTKSEYKKYIVKTDVPDDVHMMQEVVQRWAKRQEEWPDLLLIDGGQTHLQFVTSALEEIGVHDRFLIASLAKREETLHRLAKEDIILDKRGRVLVHARDEAHRFVNTFHRNRRKKEKLSDPMEGVEGLGAKKMQTLLRHFGGRKGIEHASINDLKTVPGIGPSLAQRIYDQLHT